MSLILSGTDGLSDVDGSAATPAIRGTDANTGMFFPAADTIAFAEGGVEAMRLDASGNMGIGTSSPASDARLTLASPTTESYVMFSRTNSGVFDAAVGNNGGALVFKGGADSATVAGLTEFMRLDSVGNLGLGVTPSAWVNFKALESTAGNSVYFGSSQASLGSNIYNDGAGWRYKTTAPAGVFNNVQGTYYWFQAPSGTAGNSVGLTQAMTLDSSGNLLVGKTTNNDTSIGCVIIPSDGNTGRFKATGDGGGGGASFFVTNTGGTATYIVRPNGNVQNTNNSYGAISDAKLKENIVDATPKLAGLMQVKVRNYNLIGSDKKQLGVVAQELEQVFPAMVDESFDMDTDGNNLSTTTKSVKYSVFVPMLIKAMQEQQAIIESLKARLDAANL